MKAGWMTMPLAFVATFAFLFVIGTSGAGPDVDSDGDGIQDNLDNCSSAMNADQLDSNEDGYGNPCDQDYNNDGVVGIPDFGALLGAFGTSLGDPSYDPDIDANGDDVIGIPDFGALLGSFGAEVGPSGRACANGNHVPDLRRCPGPDFPL